MREGANVSKDVMLSAPTTKHRVIIPLYIPHTSGYYKDAFAIFEKTLHSVSSSSVYHNTITVISDGCAIEVNEKLFSLYKNNVIDELIIERQNIGKINAILKALRTVTEPYVTITDADILFLKDWDRAVFDVFKAFKKAAVVSPIPVFRKQFSYTANIWIDHLTSKALQFRPVKDPNALEKFAQSIGWDTLEPRFKDVIMTLKTADTTAVVSAVHCVATYKTAYLKSMPLEGTTYKLGGDSEGVYLDKPPFDLDGYRLSTYANYAYHMGNRIESWFEMKEDVTTVEEAKIEVPDIESKLPGKSKLKYVLEKLILLAITKRSVYNFLLLRKGLTKAQLKTFWY
jgi:hypothetical protein